MQPKHAVYVNMSPYSLNIYKKMEDAEKTFVFYCIRSVTYKVQSIYKCGHMRHYSKLWFFNSHLGFIIYYVSLKP